MGTQLAFFFHRAWWIFHACNTSHTKGVHFYTDNGSISGSYSQKWGEFHKPLEMAWKCWRSWFHIWSFCSDKWEFRMKVYTAQIWCCYSPMVNVLHPLYLLWMRSANYCKLLMIKRFYMYSVFNKTKACQQRASFCFVEYPVVHRQWYQLNKIAKVKTKYQMMDEKADWKFAESELLWDRMSDVTDFTGFSRHGFTMKKNHRMAVFCRIWNSGPQNLAFFTTKNSKACISSFNLTDDVTLNSVSINSHY